MTALPSKMTPDEFLAWERAQEGKHHYFDGEIFDMSGGSPRHAHLAARWAARLDMALGDRCRAFSSDMRLGLANTRFVYPDAVVVCGTLLLLPGTSDVLLNPTVVVEVLSSSTEAYDRGKKQAAYLALPSIKHLVFASQEEERVEVFSRQADGSFRYEIYGAGQSVSLSAIDVRLAVSDVYAGVFGVPGEDREP